MSRLLIGTSLVAASLSAVLFWEIQHPWRPDPGTPRRPPVPGLVIDGPASDTADAAEGWTATALARPLFRDDRRPPRASVEPVTAQDIPARLAGVVTGPFGARAIFMSAGATKPVVAEAGGRVGRFVIRSIEPGRVVVDIDGGVRTLLPAFATGAARR